MKKFLFVLLALLVCVSFAVPQVEDGSYAVTSAEAQGKTVKLKVGQSVFFPEVEGLPKVELVLTGINRVTNDGSVYFFQFAVVNYRGSHSYSYNLIYNHFNINELRIIRESIYTDAVYCMRILKYQLFDWVKIRIFTVYD